MLVLSRTVEEAFVLKIPHPDHPNDASKEQEVKIRVIDVVGNKRVRIGIEAPREIAIIRTELMNTPG